jgi:hypothetical protein
MDIPCAKPPPPPDFPFYNHEWNGRPTKELYSMSLTILQQMYDFTDDLALEQFCFNIQWHYALNITNVSDAASCISHKSLWTMRNLISTDETYNKIFDKTLQTLARNHKTNLSRQRMDSVHVKSNMRNLGRIRLFARTIKKFLVNLKRQYCILFDQLDESLTARYLSKKAGFLFAMVKPSESNRTLDQLAEDVFILTQHFGSETPIHDMSIFSVKHPGVRGMKAECFAAVMKAIGVNTFRSSRYRKLQIDPPIPPCDVLLAVLAVYCLIKEQFKRRFTRIHTILYKFSAESVKSF